MNHACPVCRCNLGKYALVGYHEGKTDLPGMAETVIRLSRELREARMALAKGRR